MSILTSLFTECDFSIWCPYPCLQMVKINNDHWGGVGTKLIRKRPKFWMWIFVSPQHSWETGQLKTQNFFFETASYLYQVGIAPMLFASVLYHRMILAPFRHIVACLQNCDSTIYKNFSHRWYTSRRAFFSRVSSCILRSMSIALSLSDPLWIW